MMKTPLALVLLSLFVLITVGTRSVVAEDDTPVHIYLPRVVDGPSTGPATHTTTPTATVTVATPSPTTDTSETATATVSANVPSTATMTPTATPTATGTQPTNDIPPFVPTATYTPTTTSTPTPTPTHTLTPTHPPSAPGDGWVYIQSAPGVRALAAAGTRLFAATADDRLLAREIIMDVATWTDVGMASDVVDMAGDGEMLYALTEEHALFERLPLPYEIDWHYVDNVSDATAMALGHLLVEDLDYVYPSRATFVTTAANRLLTDSGWYSCNGDEPWCDIGHANQVKALTAVSEELFAVTSAGKLWRRMSLETSSDVGLAWEYMGQAQGIVALAAANSRLYGVTEEGHLWWRHMNPTPLDARYCDYVMGPIFGDFSLTAGCDYHVQGAVVVQSDARLYIPEDVAMEFESAEDWWMPSTYLVVKGALVADGEADKPVWFTVAGDGWRWGGISLDGPLSYLEHVVIEQVVAGYVSGAPPMAALEVNAPAHLSHITLQHNWEALWLVDDSETQVVFEYGTISGNTNAIFLGGRNNAVLNTIISDNSGEDSHAYPDAPIYISGWGNTFRENVLTDNYSWEGEPGISVIGEYAHIENNVFHRRTDSPDPDDLWVSATIALRCGNGSSCRQNSISGNLFLDEVLNLAIHNWWYDTAPVYSCYLTDNIFHGDVFLGNCDAHNNEFRAPVTLGDSRIDGEVRMTKNTFLSTVDVAGCPTSTEAEPGINNNNFLSTADTVLTVLDGPGCNVNLASNWWGTTDSAEIANKIRDGADDPNLNTVDYTSFLPDLVSDAGPR